VENSCEFGIEPSGSIKGWETIECLTTGDLSSSAQLHSQSVSVSLTLISEFYIHKKQNY
jgi:hypothetical protein